VNIEMICLQLWSESAAEYTLPVSGEGEPQPQHFGPENVGKMEAAKVDFLLAQMYRLLGNLPRHCQASELRDP
jgi:hypothetical protein